MKAKNTTYIVIYQINIDFILNLDTIST